MARTPKSLPPRPPRILTEAEEVELRVWYYSARTATAKAAELGISRTALYDYIFRKHKPKDTSLHPRSCKDQSSENRGTFLVEHSEGGCTQNPS